MSLALTALLAAPADADSAAPEPTPAASVELRVTAVDDGPAMVLEQAVLRSLGDRLLEDGYRVVPAGREASVRVWIHIDHDGAQIEARGAQQRTEVVATGDPQLVALEIQQLTSALVEEVRATAKVETSAVIVELDAQLDQAGLREGLQAGLLARGHALARSPAPGDLRLCVAGGEAGELGVAVIEASRRCGGGSASPETTPVPDSDDAALRREYLLDSASTALREWAPTTSPEPAPAPAPKPELPPADEPTVDPGLELAPDELDAEDRRRPSLTIAAHGGLLARAGGPDPALGLRVRGGRRRGIGGAVELALVPSQAERLRVFELLPSAALDWRVGFAHRGIVTLGASAGAHVHRYAQTGAGGERGVRVGPSVAASARLGFLARRGLLLFGGLRGGWSGVGSVHVLDGQPTWQRGRVTLGLELGLGWDISLAARPGARS